MTLHLDKLTLYNFGPYKGKQDIELTPRPSAPLTLIHGENTLGKTQLFSALRWCLYGVFEPNESPTSARQTIESRFNRIARRDGETEMRVSVAFTANGQPYRLSRIATFAKKQPEVSADLRIGPTVMPAAQIESEIGRLLHPKISEFFLFDAELMTRFYERLNTDRERALIRESIESVLGVPALQLAHTDLATLANDAVTRQAKASKSRAEADRLRRRLSAVTSEQASLERDRAETVEALKNAESELKIKRELLKQVEGLHADIREQELFEARLKEKLREEQAVKAEMKALLAEGWIGMAAAPLASVLQQVQAANTKAVEHSEEINRARARIAALEDRARGGDCPTCSQPLPPPDASTSAQLEEARARLEGLLSEVGSEAPDLGRERRVQGLVDRTKLERYIEKHEELSTILMTQYEMRQLLQGIADRLEGNSAADIRALASEVRRLEAAVKSASESIENSNRRIRDLQKEVQKIARQIDRLPSEDPEVAAEASFFTYVTRLFDQTIERYRERVRADVERATSEMFLKLIRDPEGYAGIRIGSDYSVDIKYSAGSTGDTSEGGKQLLALSLIGALKHAAVRGGPVVIDSPLGRLDLEHRANVLRTWIPSLGAQAILLVQSGELTQESAHLLVGEQIAHEYRIIRPDNNPEYARIERAQ